MKETSKQPSPWYLQSYAGLEEYALRSDFPTHDIWFVSAVYSPTAWCSKPKDMSASTLIMYQPDDLRDAITREIEEMDPGRVRKLAAMPGLFS